MTAPNGASPEAEPRMMQGIWPAPAEGRTVALDADECDVLIERFANRIRHLHVESSTMLAELDELQRRYLRHIERRE